MHIRFLTNYTVKAAEASEYEKNEVYEVSEASALHFVNRKAAVIVEKPKPKRGSKATARRNG